MYRAMGRSPANFFVIGSYGRTDARIIIANMQTAKILGGVFNDFRDALCRLVTLPVKVARAVRPVPLASALLALHHSYQGWPTFTPCR